MTTSRKRVASQTGVDLQELREQEVLRANRELVAYFKGRRTEREARAALKIVKAFIRDRERIDPAKRRPLPGTAVRQVKRAPTRKSARAARRRKPASASEGPVASSAPPPTTSD